MRWRSNRLNAGLLEGPARSASGRGVSIKLRLVIGLVALLLIVTDLLQLRASRSNDIAAAHTDCVNLARSLAGHAHGTFQVTTTVLAGLAERAQVDGMSGASLDRLDRLMNSRLTSLPMFHQLLLLDDDGVVVAGGQLRSTASSGPAAPEAKRRAPDRRAQDRDEGEQAFFLHHRQDRSADAYIGKTVRDLRDGSWVVTVSRRLERQDGSFLGVAVAEIAVGFFQALYDSVDVGRGGIILLALQDGTVLVRHPSAESSIGQDLLRDEHFASLVSAAPGQHRDLESLFNGGTSLASMARVDRTGLLVVTARERHKVLDGWRQSASFHAGALAVVLSGLFWLGARLSHQMDATETDRHMLELRQAQLLEAQAASAEALQRLELAESIAHVGNWRLSLPDGTLSWSDEVFRIYALQKSNFQPTTVNVIDLHHPADVSLITGGIERAWKDGQPFEVCVRIIRPGGELRHVVTRGAPQVDLTGDAVAIFGVSIDVTEQKAIESRLLDAQAQTAAANKALEAIAMQDGLTGLANRRQFDRALNHEFRRALRTGTSLALVLIDVDRFKEFNDRYGHPSGDDCLRAIAGAIPRLANRPGDLVARYGGEEIAILLPGNDIAGTRTVAEAVAQAVRDLRVVHEGSDEGFVTVSVGFEAFEPAHKHDVAGELVQRADIALYAAKRDGRNAVRCYGEIQPYADAMAG